MKLGPSDPDRIAAADLPADPKTSPPEEESAAEDLLEELIIEEIPIDGICGVY